MRESQRAATTLRAATKETSGRAPVSARTRVLLALVLAAGLAASVTGLDWGLPYQWHTDEKVTQALNVLHSPRWDPDYFINPHLHIYLVAAAFRIAYAVHPGYEVGRGFPEILPMMDRASPVRKLQFLAMRLSRGESVLFGLATVLMVFALGRRHWGEIAGLFAAAFAAVTMGLVNLWHFATPEALLFLLMVTALGLLDRIIERGTTRDYVLAGACIGLACSTKYTAWLLAVPFLTAHVAGRGLRGAVEMRGLRGMTIAGIAAILAFVATGSLVEVKRSYGPYLSLLGDGLGWPLFGLSVAGLIAAAVHLLRRGPQSPEWRGYLIHGTWVAVFYAFYGLSPHHALRFIMPIAPSLVLLAAGVWVTFAQCQRRAVARRLTYAGLLGVLIYSGMYTARADYMFLRDTRYPAGACFPSASRRMWWCLARRR